MTIEWEEFLDPYIQAVGELKIKLRGIRKQYRKQNKHSPIEFVTGRVKPIESIKEKMARPEKEPEPRGRLRPRLRTEANGRMEASVAEAVYLPIQR